MLKQLLDDREFCQGALFQKYSNMNNFKKTLIIVALTAIPIGLVAINLKHAFKLELPAMYKETRRQLEVWDQNLDMDPSSIPFNMRKVSRRDILGAQHLFRPLQGRNSF